MDAEGGCATVKGGGVLPAGPLQCGCSRHLDHGDPSMRRATDQLLMYSSLMVFYLKASVILYIDLMKVGIPSWYQKWRSQDNY